MKEHEEPHYPQPILSVSKGRERTGKAISEFITEVLRNRKYPNGFELLKRRIDTGCRYRLQIKASAGMGKTTFVAKEIDRCKGMNVLYLVPDKGLAKEVVSRLQEYSRAEIFSIEGRSHENCQRNETAEFLGKRGLPVEGTICLKGDIYCPYFYSCPYQSQKNWIKTLPELKSDSPPWVFIASHEYLTVPHFFPKPDVVIVDESHWNSFIDIFSLTEPEILTAGDKEVGGYDGYFRTISALCQAMRKRPAAFLGLLRNDPEMDIQAAIKHIGAVIAKHSRHYASPDIPDEEIRSIAVKAKLPQLRRLLRFLEQIKYDLNRAGNVSNAITAEEGNITVHLLKQNMIPRETPVLLIDASASREINSRIWGHDLKEENFTVERNAEIIQVRGKEFSKKSLGVPETRYEEQRVLLKQVIEFINSIAEKSCKPVFVAGPKTVIESIKSRLHPKVKTGHFNALRGRNEFEDCETAIIISREQAPPVMMEKGTGLKKSGTEPITRALLSRSPEIALTQGTYINAKRKRRMKSGNFEEIEIPVHPNFMCQEVLEQIREREVEQAIDRIRIVNEGPRKTVYILNDLALDLTVDSNRPVTPLLYFRER
ncbi:MAG: hypothetical protein EOM12_10415 [Verrucomicrobiae bacterium]|nr:hypothetical protein [Verrucomicrobiae bacterium]